MKRARLFTPGFVELVFITGLCIGSLGFCSAIRYASQADEACDALERAVNLEQAAEHWLWAVQGLEACQ